MDSIFDMLLKRSYRVVLHPERSNGSILIRKDIFGVWVLGDVIYDRVELSKQLTIKLRSEKLIFVNAKDIKIYDKYIYHKNLDEAWKYHEEDMEMKGTQPDFKATPSGIISRYSTIKNIDRFVAYHPISRRESKRLMDLVRQRDKDIRNYGRNSLTR